MCVRTLGDFVLGLERGPDWSLKERGPDHVEVCVRWWHAAVHPRPFARLGDEGCILARLRAILPYPAQDFLPGRLSLIVSL